MNFLSPLRTARALFLAASLLLTCTGCHTLIADMIVRGTEPPEKELATGGLFPGRHTVGKEDGEVFHLYRFRGAMAEDSGRILEITLTGAGHDAECVVREVKEIGNGETPAWLWIDAPRMEGEAESVGPDSDLGWTRVVGSQSRKSLEFGDGRHLVHLRVNCDWTGAGVAVIAGEPSDLIGEPDGYWSDDRPTFRWVRRNRLPHHLLYGLYPVAVVLDVITSPIQALMLLSSLGGK